MFLLERGIGVIISEELEQSNFDCINQYRLVFVDPKITEISVRPRYKSLEITHMGVNKELLIPPSKLSCISNNHICNSLIISRKVSILLTQTFLLFDI